jgi:ribose-phosphate pyrophosphokinase
MPYLPYARQDKQFIKGNAFEPVSLHHVLNHLGISASRLITFTSHFQREQGVIEEYACELHNLDGFSAFVPALGKISNPFFIAPDKGMKAFAEELAGRYQGEFDFLEKSRDTTLGEIVFEEKDLCAIKGKKVIIPDDMVSSGGTLVKSVNNLKRFEPAEIYLMFVHGAFTPGAYARLQETGAKLLFTDTIKDNNSNVSVVPYLTKYLKGV